MFAKYFAVSLISFGLIGPAFAQAGDPMVQKSAIIAALAQQLGNAEAMNQVYQAQLSEMQKQLAETKTKCGETCKDTPQK